MTDAPLLRIEEPGRTPLHVVLVESIEVGRESSGLLVDDPQVSRRHLVLRPAHGGVQVADLGSTHGTTVDDEPVDGAVEVAAGSVIRLGRTAITVLGPRYALPSSISAPATARTSIERVANEVAGEAASLEARVVAERTLTVVFTDIESSTEISTAMGDARWFEVLEAHARTVHATVTDHGGQVVKSVGDGFMITFESARAAGQATMALQRSVSAPGAPFRIRAGMHTGEAVRGDGGDLFGRHVNLAARVANEAAGSEILLSSITREIVDSMGDLRFGVPRSVELKGLVGLHTVHPLLWRTHETTGSTDPPIDVP